MRSAFQIVPLYAFFGFSQPSTAATSALPRRPSRRGSSTLAMAHTPAKSVSYTHLTLPTNSRV